MVLLVVFETMIRCLNGVQFFSQVLKRPSGLSGFSTINGSSIALWVTEPSFARVLMKIEVSKGLEGSIYCTTKTAFSTHRMSIAAIFRPLKLVGACVAVFGSPSGVYCVRLPSASPHTICLPRTDQHADVRLLPKRGEVVFASMLIMVSWPS